ncbi:UNVERIFIED_CONTAM: hypothetical protein Scaly_0610300 [Sesamum calycinum]|uniref:DDE Tnp4 domain-containing protein n=1 Tax=Sesamum calycinum TaxID=2727403 RepID=A0AAW2RST5_9LAMI
MSSTIASTLGAPVTPRSAGGREALVQRPCSFEGIHRSKEIVDEIVAALTICIQVIEHIKAHRAYEGRFRRRRYSLLLGWLIKLEGCIEQSGGVKPTKNVFVPEQVVMFLSVLSHHKKNWVVKHDFIRSGHTGCLGALDGTFIGVRVPEYEKRRYRTRKSQVAVDVLCVCNPNMQFIFVLSGWEGSAADNRVLRDAVHRPNGLRVPIGAMDADFFSTAYVNTLEDDSSSQ